MKLVARDSTNNDPVAQAMANVSLIKNNGEKMPVATNLILNTKGFNSVLELPANGNYKISLQKEGFIDKVTVVEINATSDNQIIEKVKPIFIEDDIALISANLDCDYGARYEPRRVQYHDDVGD